MLICEKELQSTSSYDLDDALYDALYETGDSIELLDRSGDTLETMKIPLLSVFCNSDRRPRRSLP